MLKKALLALLPLAILAGGWYLMQSKSSQAPDTVKATDSNSTRASLEPTAPNPLATNNDDATRIINSIKNDSSSNNQPDTTQTIATAPVTSDEQRVEPSSVAVEPLSDEEFIRLEQQIKNDKQLRLSLVDEFRYNTDPARAKQLAALLGPYDDPEIVQTASELAYSGDLESQIAGLGLLNRIQPRSDEARDVAIELLSSGNDPELLVATMNVLATPAANANANQRQLLQDNLNNLSNHYDATIRAKSLSLLGKWDKNSDVARDAFTRGFSDPDPAVRSSATFSINNISNPNEAMVSGLLNIAGNSDENRSTRYAALRALENMPLNNTQQRLYAVAKRSANSR